MLSLAVCTGLFSIWVHASFAADWARSHLAQQEICFSLLNQSNTCSTESLIAQATPQRTDLPPLQVHPLPPTLAQWQDTKGTGDYFSQVQPTAVGYLIWSEFPIKIYIEPATVTSPYSGTPSSTQRRFQQWVENVSKAVEEWNVYLPLRIFEQRDKADIIILRSRPPLRPSFNRTTGKLELPNARSAETHYQFYLSPAPQGSVLAHRFTILLSPDLSPTYIQSAARHELGHALGIWGHSSLETDAMYFSQVRNPPAISSRDINTLKRVYQQPTRLGWSW